MKNFTDIQENLFIDTPAAVNRKTGVLYINPRYFNQLTPASKSFVIAHEYGHLINNTPNEKVADDFALWKQIGLGKDSIDVLKSFYDAMPFNTDEQIERGEKMLRSVFFKEFTDNEQVAANFHKILSANADEVSAAHGYIAKIAGKVVSTVGGVLEFIPAVGQVVGTAVVAGGAALQSGGSIAASIAAGKDAYAQAQNEQYFAVKEATDNLAAQNQLQAMDAKITATKASNSASAYLATKEKNQKTRKFLITTAICGIAVIVCLIILKK